MNTCGILSPVPVAGLLCLVVASPLLAIDTLEPFEIGFTNLDFYLASDSWGNAAADRGVSGEVMFGAGLTPRLSFYFGSVFNADGYLVGGSTDYYTGLYGTVFAAGHWDLDLILDFTSSGPDQEEFALSPGIELNWDAEPGQAAWGAYLDTGFSLTGQPAGDEHAPRTMTHLPVAVGTYRTLAPGRQIFRQFDSHWADLSTAGNHDHASVAVGYNVLVHAAVELSTEIRFSVLDPATRTWQTQSAGAFVGIIATPP